MGKELHLIFKETVYRGSKVRAWISETLLAEVMVTKKVIFQERYNWKHVASGLNGEFIRFDKTRFRSQGGTGSHVKGCILSRPLRKRIDMLFEKMDWLSIQG